MAAPSLLLKPGIRPLPVVSETEYFPAHDRYTSAAYAREAAQYARIRWPRGEFQRIIAIPIQVNGLSEMRRRIACVRRPLCVLQRDDRRRVEMGHRGNHDACPEERARDESGHESPARDQRGRAEPPAATRRGVRHSLPDSSCAGR